MTTHQSASLAVHTLSALAQSGKLAGKRVFIRSDLNVPLNGSEVADDTRIRASIPAIELALDAGAAVMVTSHLGRPQEGTVRRCDSLQPVAERLAQMLARPVPLVSDWVGGVTLSPGQLVLLENCRCNTGEKARAKFAFEHAAQIGRWLNLKALRLGVHFGLVGGEQHIDVAFAFELFNVCL